MRATGGDDARLREVAVMFHLREALRSGDIWLDRSHRYGDLRHVFVPLDVAHAAKLAASPDPQSWLADRKVRLADGLARLDRGARSGMIPKDSTEDGTLSIDRLTADPPDGIEDLVLDLYRRLPPVRITDFLLEVDTALGFTDAFMHLLCQRFQKRGSLKGGREEGHLRRHFAFRPAQSVEAACSGAFAKHIAACDPLQTSLPNALPRLFGSKNPCRLVELRRGQQRIIALFDPA